MLGENKDALTVAYKDAINPTAWGLGAGCTPELVSLPVVGEKLLLLCLCGLVLCVPRGLCHRDSRAVCSLPCLRLTQVFALFFSSSESL